MTRVKRTPQIDIEATLRAFADEAQRLTRERIQRELRYNPHFTGAMSFHWKFRNGVPFAIELETHDNRLIEPLGQ